MPHDLIDSALKRAEQSEPVVRSAALLHIARVMTAFDREEATRILERGVALTEALPEPERGVMRKVAVSLAATVSPDRAFQLAAAHRSDARGSSVDGIGLTKALFDMISHGHRDRAIQYLSDPSSVDEYPFSAAQQALDQSIDDATRQRVLSTASEAMRKQLRDNARSSDLPRFHEFVRLFNWHWRVLPTDAARAIVRELAEGIVAKPDKRIDGGFNGIRFSSTRQHRLFSMLGPLRHLEPVLTDALLRDHPELAAGAESYPFGEESLLTAARQQPVAPPPADFVRPPDLMLVGRRLIPMPEAIATEFKEAFDRALHLYASEIDEYHPNDAPQEFWPSTQEFRGILYKAGRYEGRAAIRHLDRIPDPALQLFAQIELAAALANLPQIGFSSISPGPFGFREGALRRARHSASERVPAPPPELEALPIERPNLPPSLDAQIAPTRHAADTLATGGSGADYWVIQNAPLVPVLMTIYELPATRINVSPSINAVRYDLALVLPRRVDRDTMRRLMRDGIEKHFQVSRNVQTRDVFVVTAPRGVRARETFEDDGLIGGVSFGALSVMEQRSDREAFEGFALEQALSLQGVPRERAATPEEEFARMKRDIRKFMRCSMHTGGFIDNINTPMTIAELCDWLESGLDRPLVDETRLSPTYDLKVRSEVTSTAAFLKVLSDRLGLVFTPARRELEMLVVSESSRTR